MQLFVVIAVTRQLDKSDVEIVLATVECISFDYNKILVKLLRKHSQQQAFHYRSVFLGHIV